MAWYGASSGWGVPGGTLTYPCSALMLVSRYAGFSCSAPENAQHALS